MKEEVRPEEARPEEIFYTLPSGESKEVEFVFLTDREVTLDHNTDITMHIFESADGLPATGEVTAKERWAVARLKRKLRLFGMSEADDEF